MRVCLDPGHGGRDTGARSAGDRYEKESNLRCALLLRKELEEMDARVLLTRSDDEDLSLPERANLANRWNADIFISLHADWAPNPAARGHHAIHSVFSSPGQGSHRLARFLVDRLTETTGRDPWPRGDRGVWSRWNSSGDADYYGVIRRTQMPAVILERGFLSNAEDADLLFEESFLQLQAEAIAAAVGDYFGVRKVTPIVGPPELSALQASRWARENGAHDRFIDIADEYWLLGTRIGIRPEIAYAQSARETGFGHYGGVVRPEQNNWAGIKTADAAGDRPEDHQSFDTPGEGVRAHYNHLAAYVGVEPLGEPHPRYHLVTSLPWAGTIGHVEEMGGHWAPDPDYGRDIVRLYIGPLMATARPDDPDGDDDTVPREKYDACMRRVSELQERLRAIRDIAEDSDL